LLLELVQRHAGFRDDAVGGDCQLLQPLGANHNIGSGRSATSEGGLRTDHERVFCGAYDRGYFLERGRPDHAVGVTAGKVRRVLEVPPQQIRVRFNGWRRDGRRLPGGDPVARHCDVRDQVTTALTL